MQEAAALATVALAAQTPAQSLSFADFSDVSAFSFNASAAQSGSPPQPESTTPARIPTRRRAARQLGWRHRRHRRNRRRFG